MLCVFIEKAVRKWDYEMWELKRLKNLEVWNSLSSQPDFSYWGFWAMLLIQIRESIVPSEECQSCTIASMNPVFTFWGVFKLSLLWNSFDNRLDQAISAITESLLKAISLSVCFSRHCRWSDRLPLCHFPHPAAGVPHEEEGWRKLRPWRAQTIQCCLPEGTYQGVLCVKLPLSVSIYEITELLKIKLLHRIMKIFVFFVFFIEEPFWHFNDKNPIVFKTFHVFL